MKSFFFSKDFLSFLFFLVLSAAFWFVHSLNRERESTLVVPLAYSGLPEEVEVQNKLPQKISIRIRDEGFKLLQYSRKTLTPLTIDLDRVYFGKGKVAITPDQLKNKLSKYVLPTTAVLRIIPDSIGFSYYKLSTAELPIKLDAHITLSKQYMLSDSVKIDPKKIKIFGSASIIDTMKAVYTEKIKLDDVSDTTLIKVKLAKKTGVKYPFNDVSVGLFVEMFTENKTQIPVTVINAPERKNIRVFPVEVSATYNVGLSKFNKIKEGDILAIFDYKNVVNTSKRKNKLNIAVNAGYISNVRIYPEEIEFLIEDK